MTQTCPIIQWPAMIKLHGDDELIFVADGVQFASDAELQQMHIQPQDILIDSRGATYSISKGQTLELMNTGAMLSLHDIEALLRLHLSSNGNCCVSKFYSPSIREAIMSVGA